MLKVGESYPLCIKQPYEISAIRLLDITLEYQEDIRKTILQKYK